MTSQSLILGTAQWGMDYGVTNEHGRPTESELHDLVGAAKVAGVMCLDTAPAYGDAEFRIGALGEASAPFALQTKVLCADFQPGRVESSVSVSLERLGRSKLTRVLIHDWDLVDPELRKNAVAELESLRTRGVVESVGISGYEEASIVSAEATFDQLDVVQIPVSILDQRLIDSPVVARIRERGARIQARSIFLQGAALATASHPMLGSHADVKALRESGNAMGACLGFIAAQDWIDDVVVGVATADQLSEIHEAWAKAEFDGAWAAYASSDPWLIDPRRWTTPATRE